MSELRPTKIVCVGRNYLRHASELGNVVPEEPLIFLKPPSALLAEGDPIVIPPGVGRVDFEGEIAVTVAYRATRVPEADALAVLGAVLPLNDVTARDLQRSDDQWTRAKGFDTFCPAGRPVPVDDVDLATLSVVTRVNGEERQRGSVEELAFSIPFLVSWISGVMTLEPGDIISTGTPEGVGPLEPGDEVEVEIPGVGSVTNPVRAAEDAPP